MSHITTSVHVSRDDTPSLSFSTESPGRAWITLSDSATLHLPLYVDDAITYLTALGQCIEEALDDFISSKL